MHHARSHCVRDTGQLAGRDGIDRVRKLSFGFSTINCGVGRRIHNDAWFDA
jgi:hypothetical protein